MKRLLTTTAIVAGALWSAAPAYADFVYVDPATIHVGSGQGTSCVTGGCPQFGNEVNAFGNTGFDLYQNSGGANALVSPVLAILLVPNSPGTLPAGTISAANYYATASTTSNAGGTSVPVTAGPSGYNLTYLNQATGYVGTMTAGDNVYSFLAAHDSNATFQAMFASGPNSVSFTNLAAADLAVENIVATGFGVYVYGISTAIFAANNVLDLTVPTIPAGSFAVGFGFQGSPTSNPNPYDTPFTETAISKGDPVPEPTSLALLGVGLLGLGFVTAKRRN